jgi:3-methyladenine DNA glycosylase AlkC
MAEKAIELITDDLTDKGLLPSQKELADPYVWVEDESIEQLIDLLEDDDRYVRIRAAFCLGLEEADASEAVDSLIDCLGDEDHMLRWICLDSLPKISSDPNVAEKIAELLSDEEPYIQCKAAKSLGDMGPAAKGTVLDLLSAFEDENPDVRVAVIHALRNVDPKADGVVDAFITAVEADYYLLRMNAFIGLGTVEGNPDVADILFEHMWEGDNDLRIAARNSFIAIAPATGHLMPRLIEKLNDSDKQYKTIYILGEMGSYASAALPELRKIADYVGPDGISHHVFRDYALKAIAKIEGTYVEES